MEVEQTPYYREVTREVTRLPGTGNQGNGTPPTLTPPTHKRNGRTRSFSGSPRGSPRVNRRQDSGSALSSTSHAHHQTRIICNSLWGQKLTFHSYLSGEDPIVFSSLWPEKRTFVEIYRDADLSRHPYELCKLLLATNSFKALDILLDEQVLPIDCDFGGRCGTLLHLACALGLLPAIQSLVRRSQANTKLWATKDAEGHIPEEVCVKAELRKLLPSHSLFTRNKCPIQVHSHKPQHKKEIFDLATKPDNFYCLINMLNSYPTFDVNSERNSDGDLLIHVAIKGGLPQLPLLFTLVNYYKADIRLKDGSETTPLSLAVTLGEETLAEVLICVFGLDINEGCTPEKLTPLHVAVNSSRPRIVTMLLRRGADALKEDKSGCIPSFLARKQRAYECRQVISQHMKDRTEKFCQDTISGVLQVSQLYPSDLCAVSSTGCTLLMLAAMHNHETLLRELLKKGDSPLDFRQMKSCDLVDSLTDSLEASWVETDHDKDHTLKTAVHFAAERGNLGCLQLLLEANAHPSLQDGTCWLPLHYAVDRGHIECVKAILAYPNQLGLTGLKPALDISRGNHFNEITAVLESAYERRQQELVTPLLFEVAHSGDTDVIFHVLQNGDNINPLNESNDWPLLLAAGFGYDTVVAQLHQFGGHVAKRHRISRSTPLHVAARGGHTKVVRYLLQFCRHPVGVLATPLPSGMMEDEDAQFIDINGRNTAGATPLELAASQGHTEAVKLLLEKGASTTVPDSNGRLLSCASFAGTQFLLETHRKERGRTIIECLRSRSRLKNFRQCWQGPSDFNLYASNGDNMLMVAAQHAVPEVLKFLLDQAAAVKPGTLMSSEQEPLLLNSLSSSRESSDTSLPTMHSRNKSDSNIDPVHSFVPKAYDPDMGEPERRTALPTVFRTPPHQRMTKQQRFTASGGHGGGERLPDKPSRYHRGGSSGWPRTTTSGTTSSEEDEPVGIMVNGVHTDEEACELPEPFISLLRFPNPRDGQTALHRASAACQHLNVSMLLKRDEELANLQDKEGNTALHLACAACSKTQKQTVQALLSFKCVMTTIRNGKNELPEQHCLKNAIKKLVCKVRQSRAGVEFGLPDPPHTDHIGAPPPGSGISVSMEQTNGQPPAMPHGYTQLPGIPEMVTPVSSMVSDLSLTDLNTRLQQMKSEINAVPIPQENVSN